MRLSHSLPFDLAEVTVLSFNPLLSATIDRIVYTLHGPFRNVFLLSSAEKGGRLSAFLRLERRLNFINPFPPQESLNQLPCPSNISDFL